MSIKLYDDAFIQKLKSWTQSTNVTIVGPSETKRLFEVLADTSNDKPIKLPLISLKRGGGFSILHATKHPMSHSGARLDANNDKSKILNMVPISIPYQLDVYTRYLEEADEYIRNLVFNIINYPKLDIVIPYYEENRTHVSNIRITGDVEDNSDIPERLISGQFTRYSIKIEIDDAYLFDIKYKDVKHLEVETLVDDESIIVIDSQE